jgi:small subunit ribosomal protein S20
VSLDNPPKLYKLCDPFPRRALGAAGTGLQQETTDVAHSLSAKKRVRQNAKNRARNRARKDSIKTELKAFTAALTSGALDKAAEALKGTVRALDKVAAKNTIHKNAAARKRSRLTKRLNAAKALAAAGGPKVTATKGKGKKKAGAGTQA